MDQRIAAKLFRDFVSGLSEDPPVRSLLLGYGGLTAFCARVRDDVGLTISISEANQAVVTLLDLGLIAQTVPREIYEITSIGEDFASNPQESPVSVPRDFVDRFLDSRSSNKRTIVPRRTEAEPHVVWKRADLIERLGQPYGYIIPEPFESPQKWEGGHFYYYDKVVAYDPYGDPKALMWDCLNGRHTLDELSKWLNEVIERTNSSRAVLPAIAHLIDACRMVNVLKPLTQCLALRINGDGWYLKPCLLHQQMNLQRSDGID
jgi:hypothetical protein